MRTFLILWFGPIIFLSLWYGLSVNDLSFGMFFFSRELHDMVFEIYGNALGMEPEAIPPLVVKAVAIDSLFVLAIVALRYRKKWWPYFSAAWHCESRPTVQGNPAK